MEPHGVAPHDGVVQRAREPPLVARLIEPPADVSGTEIMNEVERHRAGVFDRLAAYGAQREVAEHRVLRHPFPRRNDVRRRVPPPDVVVGVRALGQRNRVAEAELVRRDVQARAVGEGLHAPVEEEAVVRLDTVTRSSEPQRVPAHDDGDHDSECGEARQPYSPGKQEDGRHGKDREPDGARQPGEAEQHTGPRAEDDRRLLVPQEQRDGADDERL